MTYEPYREEPTNCEGDQELARLAAEGERRALDANEKAAAEKATLERRRRDDNVRRSIGAYDGRRPPYVLMSVSVLGGAASFVTNNEVVIMATLLVLILGWIIWGEPPSATSARVRAEEAWIASLPFSMSGYFEALSDPSYDCELVIDIDWHGGSPPEPGTIHGIMGLLDPEARIDVSSAGHVVLRSKKLKRSRQYNRTVSVPTRAVVDYVHRLVSTVLMPMHRSHPIASVSLGCEHESLGLIPS